MQPCWRWSRTSCLKSYNEALAVRASSLECSFRCACHDANPPSAHTHAPPLTCQPCLHRTPINLPAVPPMPPRQPAAHAPPTLTTDGVFCPPWP